MRKRKIVDIFRQTLSFVLDKEDRMDTKNVLPKEAKNNDSIEIKANLTPVGDSKLSDMMFEDLEISQLTKDSLKDLNLTHLTEIQGKSITHQVEGKDILGRANTGSGKTLAFLIPAIEALFRKKFTPNMGRTSVFV